MRPATSQHFTANCWRIGCEIHVLLLNSLSSCWIFSLLWTTVSLVGSQCGGGMSLNLSIIHSFWILLSYNIYSKPTYITIFFSLRSIMYMWGFTLAFPLYYDSCIQHGNLRFNNAKCGSCLAALSPCQED